MSWSIEAVLNSDDYKEFLAKRVFLFVLGKLRREEVWSSDECRNYAYDITMEGITLIMEKEKTGIEIKNKYAYLMEIVKNLLKKKKFRFQKDTAKNSFTSIIDGIIIHGNPDLYNLRIASYAATTEIAYTNYDFSTMINTLTPEERSVALLLDAGYDGKMIADHLRKSRSTISRMIASIRIKMDEQKPRDF